MNYVSYISTFVIALALVALTATFSMSLRKPPVQPADINAEVAKLHPVKKLAKHHRRHHRPAPIVEHAGAGFPTVSPKIQQERPIFIENEEVKANGLVGDTPMPKAAAVPKYSDMPSGEDIIHMPGVPGTTRPQGQLEGSPGYKDTEED